MGRIIRANGPMEDHVPADGRESFNLEELQEVVDGYIELIPLPNDEVMVVNEDGQRLGLPQNHEASRLYRSQILGDVLVASVVEVN